MTRCLKNVAIVCLAACIVILLGFGAAAAQQVSPKTSLSGQWTLLPLPAPDSAKTMVPVLEFNLASCGFVGYTGCNAFSGKFVLNGNKLSFVEQNVLTQNNCPGYDEDAFMANLIKVNHYKINNGMLNLMVDGIVLSKWVRKQPAITYLRPVVSQY